MLLSLIHGELDFTSAVIEILAVLLIIFLVLPFHEWAHAFTASKLGDTSVKYRGRLTLNPLAHIDPFGALALLLFGFGWAKPVPVDSRNFKHPRRDMAITALMGPAANLVAALVGALVFSVVFWIYPLGVLPVSKVGYYVNFFFSYYIIINIRLAVFNLLPIPPLDGSKLLFVFIPEKWVYAFYRYQQYISIAMIVLLYLGILSYPISFISGFIEDLIKLILPPLQYSFIG